MFHYQFGPGIGHRPRHHTSHGWEHELDAVGLIAAHTRGVGVAHAYDDDVTGVGVGDAGGGAGETFDLQNGEVA